MPTLDWLNRDVAFRTAAQVPARVLRPHRAAPAAVGAGADFSGNLLIQGDNLDALAALLPFYRGRVKCIFIDQPYNTKSAFEHYDDNLEHSPWLSMMLPRLQLLRELLNEDGSIWVTLGDAQAHHFRVLGDEVFGRAQFIIDIACHNALVTGAQAPARRGETFVPVPRLCYRPRQGPNQGELALLEREAVLETVDLNLLAQPVAWAGFTLAEQGTPWALYLDGQKRPRPRSPSWCWTAAGSWWPGRHMRSASTRRSTRCPATSATRASFVSASTSTRCWPIWQTAARSGAARWRWTSSRG